MSSAMTVASAPTGAPLALDQLAVLVRRSLRTSARVPQLLMFSLTMPMAMLVLFSQVFRSVADSPGFPAGVSYIDFLTPAMLAVSTVMAGTNAGVAAAIDHVNGLHDRFATLPMSARLPAVARTLNEALFTMARGALLIAAATALGFRFHGDALDAAAGLLVVISPGGRDERPVRPHRRPAPTPGRRPVRRDDDHDAAHVHLGARSRRWTRCRTGWRTLAAANPVSYAIDALRGSVLGTATLGDTVAAVAAAAGLWALATLWPRSLRRSR